MPLKLTASQVRDIVTSAIERSTRKWIPGREVDAARALQQIRDELRGKLIWPTPSQVNVQTEFVDVVGERPGPIDVWMLTTDDRNRLFYDERSSSFGVAWGPDVDNMMYVDLGIRTPDPIDAYLA